MRWINRLFFAVALLSTLALASMGCSSSPQDDVGGVPQDDDSGSDDDFADDDLIDDDAADDDAADDDDSGDDDSGDDDTVIENGIAWFYAKDTQEVEAVRPFLQTRGFTVLDYSLNDYISPDLSPFDMIVVDTSLDAINATAFNDIVDSAKPILMIGKAYYMSDYTDFSWLLDHLIDAGTSLGVYATVSDSSIYHTPNELGPDSPDDFVSLYNTDATHYGVTDPTSAPTGTQFVSNMAADGLLPCPLVIYQQADTLIIYWGVYSHLTVLNDGGKDLLHNLAYFMQQ